MSTFIGAKEIGRLAPNASSKWLGRVERLGNALPHPVMIFIVLIVALMIVSSIGATLDWQALFTACVDLFVCCVARALFCQTASW